MANASMKMNSSVGPAPLSTSLVSQEYLPKFPTSQVPNMEGGAKKSRKSTTPKKPAGKKCGGSAKKQGGALMDDVKNLAVPFAILLAKQGLQSMFDSSKASKSVGASARATPASGKSVELEASSSRRRAAAVGGSCGSACAQAAMPALTQSAGKKKSQKPRKGGAEESASAATVKTRFEKLSKEIDEFLAKY